MGTKWLPLLRRLILSAAVGSLVAGLLFVNLLHARLEHAASVSSDDEAWALMLCGFGTFGLVLMDFLRARGPGAVPAGWPPRCAGCGYDLRAGRGACPECGTPIPAATAATIAVAQAALAEAAPPPERAASTKA